MSAFTLPLSSIINVVVEVSPIAPSPPAFNQGLILGSSAVIPSWGPNSRVRQYNSLAGMVSDGFATNSPEYLSASLYLSQSPPPGEVWIGRQDLTGTTIQTAVPHTANEGTGYVVGDVLNVSTGTGGQVKVTTVGGSGNVTGIAIVADGTGYTTGTAVATTGGSGTGCEVDITVGNEAYIQAAQYCRDASPVWYGLYAEAAAKANHEALAAWAQSASPLAMYFYNTADADVPTTLTTDVMSFLQAAQYNRACGIYSTTQGGNAPNNAYAGAALMGAALGLNTQLIASYFTLKFKPLVGVITEPLSQTAVTNITSKNGNMKLSFANAYQFVVEGKVANGQFFDEVINLDVLAADIQFALMNLLVSTPSIPQTDPGQTLLIHAVNGILDNSVSVGFIAPGVWQGVQILKLVAGTSLPKGYLTQSPPYAQQNDTDRIARKSMPIYAAIIEAGAVHSVLIGIYVQR